MNTFLLLSFFIPPLGLPLGLYGLYKDFAHWRKYVFCLALFAWAYAYSVVPVFVGGEENGPDLARYFADVQILGKYNFFDALEVGFRDKFCYVHLFLAWLAGICGDEHLLPAFTVFVVYYVGLYILCYVANDFSIKKKYLFYYLLFMILAAPFYSVVSNIRNVFAFCVVGLAVFRDVYLRKRNFLTLLLYVVPPFIHISAIVLIGLRLVLPLLNRFRLLATISLMISFKIINVLYEGYLDALEGNTVLDFLRAVVVKAYIYFNGAVAEDWINVVSKTKLFWIERYVYFAILSILCAGAYYIFLRRLTFELQNNNKAKFDVLIQFISFTYFVGITSLACWPMATPCYWRFCTAFIMFGGCIYLPIMQNGLLWIRQIVNCIFLFVLPCMMFWGKRLWSCDIPHLFWQPFASSPLMILIVDVLQHFSIVE